MNSSRSLQTESVIYFVISLRLILQMYICILQKLYTTPWVSILLQGAWHTVSMAASAIINQQQIYMVSTDFSVLNTNDCCVLNRKWLNNDNLWVEWSWTCLLYVVMAKTFLYLVANVFGWILVSLDDSDVKLWTV